MTALSRKDISVILPVYNGADMLETCVRSVLSAGKRVAEIIIVDDGSTDDTLAVAEALAAGQSRVKVIHTENHGCYAARNAGIMASSYDYIAFADVDDTYVEGALDMLADLLEKYDADIAVGGYREAASAGEQVPEEGKHMRGSPGISCEN